MYYEETVLAWLKKLEWETSKEKAFRKAQTTMGRPGWKSRKKTMSSAGMEAAEDRQEWRQIVGEAKNYLGFSWSTGVIKYSICAYSLLKFKLFMATYILFCPNCNTS